MTKTQQYLMEMLAKHSGTYSIETCYGRGPQGGKTVTHGARQRDAMFALEEQGVIKIVSRQPWSESRNGYTQGGTVIAFSLV